MTNLIVLFALLFGAQEASAFMLDSMPTVVGIEKTQASVQSPSLTDDAVRLNRGSTLYFDEHLTTRLVSFAPMGDGIGPLLTQRYGLKSLPKPGRVYA